MELSPAQPHIVFGAVWRRIVGGRFPGSADTGQGPTIGPVFPPPPVRNRCRLRVRLGTRLDRLSDPVRCRAGAWLASVIDWSGRPDLAAMNSGGSRAKRQAESITEVLDFSKLQDLTQRSYEPHPAASCAQIALRIDCFAVHPDFVMQVGPVERPVETDAADHGADIDRAPSLTETADRCA